MKHIKIFESFDDILGIINDSYNDYITLNDNEKKSMARQIRRTAEGFIKYRNFTISDWTNKFKDEEIIMDELAPLIYKDITNKYNL